MKDENDHFVRWFQAMCAVPLLAFAAFDLYLFLFRQQSGYAIGRNTLGIGAGYLAYRCLFYAITGRKNINRDDF